MSCLKAIIESRYVTYDNESKVVLYAMCNDQSCIAYGTECLGKDKCHFYVENAFEKRKLNLYLFCCGLLCLGRNLFFPVAIWRRNWYNIK